MTDEIHQRRPRPWNPPAHPAAGRRGSAGNRRETRAVARHADDRRRAVRAELKLVNEKNVLPFVPESAAAKAKGPLLPGDRIVQIDGQPIGSYGQLQDFLVAHADEDLTVTVARSKEAGGKEAKPEDTEKVQITVPKSPMKQFGLTMEMGPIAAVQTDSPAAEAGIKPAIC